MRVIFDNTGIVETENAGIQDVSVSSEIFSNSFYLGATPSIQYTLKIDKMLVTEQPTVVKLYDDADLFATLVVDDIAEDDNIYTYTLTDSMVNFEFYYDASAIFNEGSATLLQIALDICSKAGVELATQNFRSYNKSISWYDNTRTAREYIGYIAELNGGYAQIGSDGKLYFIKQKQDSIEEINIDDCENFTIGEKRTITKVQLEVTSTLSYIFGNDDGNTLTLNSDNVFITTEDEVRGIYNDIKDFTFYNFETSNCPINYNIKAGNIITFLNGDDEYPTIAQFNLSYNNEWIGGYYLTIDSIKQEETQLPSTDTKIKNLRIIVDRDTNTITQAVEEIDGQNEKISQIKQTVDELNSKITEIADITISKESINANVSLEDINESEPIRVVIHPINENISYLYPNSNLFPSDTLFSKTRTLRFTNTKTSEIFDYILPDNLLIASDGTYDEFILDYEGQSCTITKKVGYNSDGSTYVLSTQETTEYAYPSIELTDGDYTVQLLGYSSAYLFVRLMAQNIYTSQYATKAELNSKISQTSSQIELNVDTKLTNYVTDTEMNSAITLSANNITSSVSNTYATKTALESTTNTLNSTITQKADEITSTVSSTYATKDTTNNLQSQITQNANQITTKVTSGNVVSEVNQSAEQLTLKSNRLVVNSNNFTLKSDGTMSCSNANVSGTITAESGTIGGWELTDKKLRATADGKVAAMQAPSSDTTWVFASGGTSHDSYSDCPFRVSKSGTLYATDAHIKGAITATSGTFTGTVSGSTITGSKITCGSNFSVSSSGDVTAKSVTITGGSITGTGISYSTGNYKTTIDNSASSTGQVCGYNNGVLRYALASFTSGGIFQTFNSSGIMKAYFDINGAHTSSDITMKENISNINENTSMNIIKNLNPIEYNYIGEDISQRHRGLSAQEVEGILKEQGIANEIYEINREGKYSLNYIELIPDLINCIKYQQSQIEDLQERINKLEDKEE